MDFNADPKFPPHEDEENRFVRGDLLMAVKRPEHDAPVPIKMPVKNAIWFSGERGSMPAGIRSASNLSPKPLPPMKALRSSSVIKNSVVVCVVRSISKPRLLLCWIVNKFYAASVSISG